MALNQGQLLIHITVVVGWAERTHLVNDAAHRPDVHFKIVRLPSNTIVRLLSKDFWSCVGHLILKSSTHFDHLFKLGFQLLQLSSINRV